MKKYPIEKNTVQETLVIPLYGRKMCSELFPALYHDETAIRLMDAVDYDFSALAAKTRGVLYRFGFLEVAMRQNDLAAEVREYLKEHPQQPPWSISAVGWTIPDAPVTTVSARICISIFPM